MGSEDGCYMRWAVGASLLRVFLLGWGSEDVCVLRVGGWMDGRGGSVYKILFFSLFLWLLWMFSGPYIYFYPLNIRSLGYHPLTQ